MAELEKLIFVCNSNQVNNGGDGYRFHVPWESEITRAFVIRYNNTVYGYLNRCAHQAIELDWNEGEFFDRDGRFLICTTHGAMYEPSDGSCVSGRCQGRGLTKLDIVESDGKIFVKTD